MLFPTSRRSFPACFHSGGCRFVVGKLVAGFRRPAEGGEGQVGHPDLQLRRRPATSTCGTRSPRRPTTSAASFRADQHQRAGHSGHPNCCRAWPSGWTSWPSSARCITQHSSHNAGMYWSIVGRPYRMDSTLINPSRTDYPSVGTLVGWLAQRDGYSGAVPPYVITPEPHCDSTVYHHARPIRRLPRHQVRSVRPQRRPQRRRLPASATCGWTTELTAERLGRAPPASRRARRRGTSDCQPPRQSTSMPAVARRRR